jgi:hypothetical protein
MPRLQGGILVRTRPFPQRVKEVIEHLPSFFDEDLFMLYMVLSAVMGMPACNTCAL